MSFREAAILIFSPLVGLRLSRPGVSLTFNFPNPGSEISSPFAAALMMLFQRAAHIAWACVLLTLLASAIFVTSSAVFIHGHCFCTSSLLAAQPLARMLWRRPVRRRLIRFLKSSPMRLLSRQNAVRRCDAGNGTRQQL